jgi:hypothetical protein
VIAGNGPFSLEGYRTDEERVRHLYVHDQTVADEKAAKQIANDAGLEAFLLQWITEDKGRMQAFRWNGERWWSWRDGYKVRHYVYTYKLSNEYDPPTDEELARFSS